MFIWIHFQQIIFTLCEIETTSCVCVYCHQFLYSNKHIFLVIVMNIFSFLLYFWKEKNYLIYCINKTKNDVVSWLFTKKKNTMQGTLVNLCYTMENHAIATMMTYFGSTDHGLGTEVDRGRGGTSSKNRLESPLHACTKVVRDANDVSRKKLTGK